MNNRSIIINPTVLQEDFIPPFIHEREYHIKWLMSALFPAVRGRKPVNVWVYGKPGTGKTCVCRFVLHKLQERWNNTKGIYINCWKNNTLYAVLDQIVKEFRLLGGETPSTSVKLERFLSFVKDKPFIVILDEIDIPSPKDRNNILYNLARTGKIGIICISRSDETYYHLDERVSSRLTSRVLEFQDYSFDQTMTILRERTMQAIKVNSWNDTILKLIAELSLGDIRISLETLKSAAEYAESEGDKIALEHVHKGVRNISQLQKEYTLKRLTQHHRVIYNTIEQKPNILSGELWTTYLDVCKKTTDKPVARRTYSAYLQKLENLQLISSEKAAASGNARRFRPASVNTNQNQL